MKRNQRLFLLIGFWYCYIELEEIEFVVWLIDLPLLLQLFNHAESILISFNQKTFI